MKPAAAIAPSVHGRRKAASWLAIGALLFNLLGGLFLPVTANAAAASTAADGDFLKSVIICTPNGLRVIKLGADGAPLPEQSTETSFCVFCLPLNAGHVFAPEAPAVNALPTLSPVRPALPAQSVTATVSIDRVSSPPRAPPSFV